MLKKKNTILTTICCVLSIILLSSFGIDADWKLKKDKDGISVYTRTVEGSSFEEFKGVTVVNSSLSAFVAMLKDVDSYKKWVYTCLEPKLIEANKENEQIHYMVSEVPWPLRNRDMIVHLDYKVLNKSTLIIAISSLPSKISEKKDIVRIKEMKGSWTIKQLNDKEIQIQYQLHLEPNGSIPSWLANASVVDSPFNTLKNIKEHIKNPKYQNKSYGFMEQ